MKKSKPQIPINMNHVLSEFNYNHTVNKDFESNMSNAIRYIFNYNKNKFDPVYEEVRPVNMEYYDEESISALLRSIKITIHDTDTSLIALLIGNSFVVEDDYKLTLLDSYIIDSYFNKELLLKLKKDFILDINDITIPFMKGSPITLESGEILPPMQSSTEIYERIKNEQSVSIPSKNLLLEYTCNTDCMIMSRDIYDRYDVNKSNTFVMVFKRGLLPKWYNNIKYTNDMFYINGIPSATKHLVTFAKTDHQYYKVTTEDSVYTNISNPNGFYVDDGTEISVTLIADQQYSPGKPSLESGIIGGNIELSATPAIVKFCKVSIIQSEHQQIVAHVVENSTSDVSELVGTPFTKEFKVPFATHITVDITADSGYTPAKLNISDIVVTQNITIRADSDASIQEFTLQITNPDPDHQLVGVRYQGHEFTAPDSIKVRFGHSYEVFTTATEPGYTAGSYIDPSNGIVSGNITVSAEFATKKKYNLTVRAVDSQKIWVVCNNQVCNEGDSIEVSYGDTYVVKQLSEPNYMPADIHSSSSDFNVNPAYITNNNTYYMDAKGVVGDEGDIIISATGANTYRTVNVMIRQTPHQTISVVYNGTTYTSNFIANMGDIISATIKSTDTEYTAGQINGSFYNYTLMQDVVIMASPAIKMEEKYNVIIQQSDNQLITVRYDGNEYTNDFKAVKGKDIKAFIKSTNSEYTAGKILIENTNSGDTVISATPAESSNKVYTLDWNRKEPFSSELYIPFGTLDITKFKLSGYWATGRMLFNVSLNPFEAICELDPLDKAIVCSLVIHKDSYSTGSNKADECTMKVIGFNTNKEYIVDNILIPPWSVGEKIMWTTHPLTITIGPNIEKLPLNPIENYDWHDYNKKHH